MAVAQAYMAGMDGLKMLKNKDMFTSVVLSAAMQKIHELREQEMEHLANLITHKIVDAWNRGQK